MPHDVYFVFAEPACKVVRHAKGIGNKPVACHFVGGDAVPVGQARPPVIPVADGEQVRERRSVHRFHQVLRYARPATAHEQDRIIAVLGKDDCAEAPAVSLYHCFLRNGFCPFYLR